MCTYCSSLGHTKTDSCLVNGTTFKSRMLRYDIGNIELSVIIQNTPLKKCGAQVYIFEGVFLKMTQSVLYIQGQNIHTGCSYFKQD